MRENVAWDILIHDVSLLPLPHRAHFIENGWLAIRGSEILALGKGDPPPHPAKKRINGTGCVAMPGLINAHLHAPMALFRGLADDLPLKTWLEEHIFPAEGKWVNGEFVYWGTLLACVEMIRSGTTTFCRRILFRRSGRAGRAPVGNAGSCGPGNSGLPHPGFSIAR